MDEKEIELGKVYRDEVSGFEGVAVGRHEYLYGCTRVTLQAMSKDGDVPKDASFDAPGLVEVETETPVTSERTGGPRPTPGARSGE